jgi:hypothetical protein
MKTPTMVQLRELRLQGWRTNVLIQSALIKPNKPRPRLSEWLRVAGIFKMKVAKRNFTNRGDGGVFGAVGGEGGGGEGK